ncbi:MAG: site-specific DNA-methyltransferase, partial [Erysipelotrichia bacterium]|nr:site-specific DNA-methyltransferase [Erysipelotrichia bacterium]
EPERYNFTWAGKSEAKKIAQTPSTGTLRPCKEESKKWDTTQNLYIEGDNLEVLKLLQKSYYKQVKMIYIDPPYNTGKDFVYKDNFKDNIKNYLEITGQVDSEGNKLSKNSETSGRYHSDWLNMMYPRLKLARDLLKDDGVIFISIDDNEVANLRKVCDEIFGEDNFVDCIIWEKKYSPQNDAKWLSANHDYVVLYAKNKELWRPNLLPRSAEQNARYKNPDNDPRGIWKASDLSVKTYSKEYDYPITTPSGKTVELPAGRCWMTNKQKMQELINDNRIWFGVNGDNVPSLKRFLSEVKDGITPLTIWFRKDVGDNQEAKQELLKVMPENLFDTPKSIRLIKRMVQIGTNEDDLILDFFSGSATTSQSVMEFNAENNSRRKFILIQIQEKINHEKFHTICEVGKERIRRAGEKIIADNSDKDLSNLDIGFKVLKLDSSNIKAWDSNFENVEGSLLDVAENIKEDRSSEDLLYEILLKYGLDLTLPIEEKVIDGKKVFVIGYGALVACLDDDITIEAVEAIAKLKVAYQSEIMRVVFKDASFKDAVVKTNAYQILKQFGIDEVVSV